VTTLASAAETVMRRCDDLAACSEEAESITRPFASDSMHHAHALVSTWMEAAGMTVRRDNVGNLRGRYEGLRSDARTLLLGSHLDSVRDAGRYDGPLGVVVAIACVQALRDAGRRLPFAIEVLAFADEEGLRYGTTYLGSRAVAGTFDRRSLERVDAAGMTMRHAIRDFGGNPDKVAEDRWSRGELIGYVEVHIEQGPVLESRGLPVGVVVSIAGQNRYTIAFTGTAGHAGTVPMLLRRDALAAAAEFVLAVESEARAEPQVVATVGKIEAHPGATNVIPGRAQLSLDVRSGDRAALLVTSRRMLDLAEEIATGRKLTVHVTVDSRNEPVACDDGLVRLLSRAIEDAGYTLAPLTSGAGHDAVEMANIAPVGMLFVRCKGGVSHNPAEAVTVEDVGVAIDVLNRFMELLAKR
jgi:allantoate deiminase